MKDTFIDKSIKYYRKRLKMNQADLAKKLEITVTDMSFIENKKLYPNAEMAEWLSQALGVPIGKLYSEEELNLIIFRSK
jgi:DNA-binding XRE family transcriptional regulator